MKIYFLLFTLVCFCACSEENVPLSEVRFDEIEEIEIKSIKALTKETYFTAQLSVDGNTISYDMDDNRDKVVGKFVIEMGLVDKKGDVVLSKEDLDKFHKILSSIDQNRKEEGLVRTEFTIKSKKGQTKMRSYLTDDVKRFDDFLHLVILK